MPYATLMENLLGNPLSLTLNVLDIVLASYIIYRFLLLIRGTRGELFVKGFIGILFLLAVSRFLDMKAIFWLLSFVMVVFLIGIPIVFQVEIRRVLEFIGRGGIFRSTEAVTEFQEASRVIDAVCLAAERMSRNRTGALMIMLREQSAGAEVRGGIDLNADISTPLLENIFYSGSPLHDGAVIIDQGRVARAGCVLPLSDNPDLMVRVGTRHRAALGISERIDALALVVSEESGHISLARDGKIEEISDVLALRRTLEGELISDENTGRPSFWKRLWPTPGEDRGERLVLKLFAVMVAVIIWSLALIV